ncbi:MAG TPA: hypothetical protein VF116_17350 [Ktedonobacterales bacterium]
MSHRSTHYWLWFLLFGIIGALLYYGNKNNANTVDGETTWLIVTGVLGLIVGAKWLNEGQLAKPYDIIVGIILAVVGIVGILSHFQPDVLSKINVGGGLVTSSAILGLSLAAFPALINTFLGLVSIHHGIERSKK